MIGPRIGPRIGIVTGLEAEARIARRWGVPVAVGGGEAAGAARAAENLAPRVTGLVSFGIAGGLDPALRPGTIVVPRIITDAGEQWLTDPALNLRLGGSGGHVLLGGGAVLATPAAKREAYLAGAHVVDLESAAVARAAARHGIPCAALRAVCDDSERQMPGAVMAALDGQGRIGLLRLLRAVLRRPRDIPPLLALGRDAAQARRALLARVATIHLQ